MCGRYTHLYTWQELHLLMRLTQATEEELAQFRKRYNVAPQQFAPVVVQEGATRRAGFFRWGLLPAWSKDESFAAKTINARAETAAGSPAFRGPFRTRRCIIPISGFYEWQAQEGRGRKQPWYIRGSREPILLLAGLWDEWRHPGGEPIRTFTILTTTPNDVMKPLHSRMPAILPSGAWEAWLAPQAAPDELQSLLRPCESDRLSAVRVGTKVNAVGHEGPECLEEGVVPGTPGREPCDEPPGLFG